MVSLALLLAMIIIVKLFGASSRDPSLKRQLEIEVLPPLSTACVKILISASHEYSNFDLEEAIRLVLDRLVKRVK